MLDRLERIVGTAPGYAELRLHRNASRSVMMRQSAVHSPCAGLAGFVAAGAEMLAA